MKIGIALGSGAAKGWSHIGIIQALEDIGIHIDVVAGCSIGAYVGAAYCNGNLDALNEWASGFTEWQVASLMGVGIHRGGLISGEKVFQALQRDFTANTFKELEKPFAVVATDLYSGKEIWFSRGSVVDAVRASSAIPALFPPVWYHKRWLVDGAVVNPVPVNLCRHLGADFVIAVNLSADSRPQRRERNKAEHQANQRKTNDFFRKSKDRMQQWFGNGVEPGEIQAQQPNAPSIIGVMSCSLDILQDRVSRSRLAGEPPEILIEPQLRNFGIMEFHRTKELVEEGKNSVMRVRDQIEYLLGV